MLINIIILVMLLSLRILVLVTTAWAVQKTNRYSGKLGGFNDYTGFVVRHSIAQEVEQRVEKKMGLKNVDIMNIVENFVEWTTSKKDLCRKEKCIILNFGYNF